MLKDGKGIIQQLVDVLTTSPDETDNTTHLSRPVESTRWGFTALSHQSMIETSGSVGLLSPTEGTDSCSSTVSTRCADALLLVVSIATTAAAT
jgi:hypothetical protein